MKRIDSTLAVVIGMLLGLAGTTVPAQAAFTSITTCGFNISSPGDYQLTADLTCPGANAAINIFASGVSLKLNGHTITSSTPQAFAYGIHVFAPTGRLNHVGIQGPGKLQGFGTGIWIDTADYVQVDLITFSRNVTGLVAANDNYVTVASNIVGGSVTDNGLVLLGCTSSVITQNDASGNNTGIVVFGGGSANTVSNNTANGNIYDGISVNLGSGTRVYGNVTNGNGSFGIEVGPLGTGTQVFSNTSSLANGVSDLADDSATCSGNVWGNNVFQTANVSCIH